MPTPMKKNRKPNEPAAKVDAGPGVLAPAQEAPLENRSEQMAKKKRQEGSGPRGARKQAAPGEKVRSEPTAPVDAPVPDIAEEQPRTEEALPVEVVELAPPPPVEQAPPPAVEQASPPADMAPSDQVAQISEGVPVMEEKEIKPYDEFLGRAQKAYTAYLDAQKQIWIAYRETEQQTEADYHKVDEEAYAALTNTVNEAERIRQETEREAEDNYLKIRAQAKAAYDQNVQQSLNLYNETIRQAWEKRRQSLEQAWNIFVK